MTFDEFAAVRRPNTPCVRFISGFFHVSAVHITLYETTLGLNIIKHSRVKHYERVILFLYIIMCI